MVSLKGGITRGGECFGVAVQGHGLLARGGDEGLAHLVTLIIGQPHALQVLPLFAVPRALHQVAPLVVVPAQAADVARLHIGPAPPCSPQCGIRPLLQPLPNTPTTRQGARGMLAGSNAGGRTFCWTQSCCLTGRPCPCGAQVMGEGQLGAAGQGSCRGAVQPRLEGVGRWCKGGGGMAYRRSTSSRICCTT